MPLVLLTMVSAACGSTQGAKRQKVLHPEDGMGGAALLLREDTESEAIVLHPRIGQPALVAGAGTVEVVVAVRDGDVHAWLLEGRGRLALCPGGPDGVDAAACRASPALPLRSREAAALPMGSGRPSCLADSAGRDLPEDEAWAGVLRLEFALAEGAPAALFPDGVRAASAWLSVETPDGAARALGGDLGGYNAVGLDPGAGAPVRIVALSDLHVGEADAADLRALVGSLNALRVDAVLNTGDVTDGGEAADFRLYVREFRRLNAPAFVLPGNHDFKHDGIVPFLQLASSSLNFTARVGDLRLVGLNTGPSLVDAESLWRMPGMTVGPSELQLERFLRPVLAAERAPTLAFGHAPLCKDPEPGNASVGCMRRRADVLARQLAEDGSVFAYFGGHVHKDAAFLRDADGEADEVEPDEPVVLRTDGGFQAFFKITSATVESPAGGRLFEYDPAAGTVVTDTLVFDD